MIGAWYYLVTETFRMLCFVDRRAHSTAGLVAADGSGARGFVLGTRSAAPSRLSQRLAIVKLTLFLSCSYDDWFAIQANTFLDMPLQGMTIFSIVTNFY